MKIYNLILFIFLFSNTYAQLPKGFVYLKDVAPEIMVDLRYCSNNNFVGESVNGYNENVCILTTEAAHALKRLQDELRKEGLGLKIYDAYRPQRAVNHFWDWAKQVNDTIMKRQFYPNVDKRNLFKEEYIATRSRHSSGSTLDLTIINIESNEELDMGTRYDFFGKESWVFYNDISNNQKTNRKRLQDVMKAHGFRNYLKEWWHFTLRNEPFKNQYFDFVIE